MKKPSNNNRQPAGDAGTLHVPILSRAPGQIRLLVDAACSVYGGMGHMTLDEWRDLEQQLKRRLNNEHCKA